MSLRTRLVAGLVGLAAVGLLLLGGITYAEQRSFLYDRLDQQVRSAPGPLAHALDDRDGEGRGPGGPGGGGPGFGLPIGTYARYTSADGSTRSVVVDYRQNITARPALPTSLPAGKLVTVPGTKGSPRYRVMATED